MKIGDRIVWVPDFLDALQMRTGTVTKIDNRDNTMLLCWVDNRHKAEDCISQAYCFPASASHDLIDIMNKREELKKAFDDSMKLVYELRNKVSRGEYK